MQGRLGPPWVLALNVQFDIFPPIGAVGAVGTPPGFLPRVDEHVALQVVLLVAAFETLPTGGAG